MDRSHPLSEIILRTCAVVNLQAPVDKFVEELPQLLENYKCQRIDHPQNNLYEFALMKYLSFIIDVISGLESSEKTLIDAIESAKKDVESLTIVEEPAQQPKKKNISPENREILKNWLEDHKDKPYPSTTEKECLVKRTGLTMQQVEDWFINARRRYLPKPPSANK